MKGLRRFYRQIRNWLGNFLVGDRNWANIRFFGLVAAILVFFVAASLKWDREVVNQTVLRIKETQPGLSMLPNQVLRVLAPFLNMQTAPPAGTSGASFFAILIMRCMQDICESRYRGALRYVVAHVRAEIPSLEIRMVKQIGTGDRIC
jgi:hypothetical protein